MTAQLALLFGGAAVCLVTQAFFSGSEMAMVAADRTRLQVRADEGNAGAELALQLLDDDAQLISTSLIGTNISVVTGTTLVATGLATLGFDAALLTALVFVPFSLVLGETLSKRVAQYHADRLAPTLAWPIRFAQILFAPALVLVRLWSTVLSRLLGGPAHVPITREELVELLEDQDGDAIDDDERRLVQAIFAISGMPVEEVMTPLVEVHAVDEQATVGEAVAEAVASGHSRLPVYRDRVDNLVGVLTVPDLLFGAASTDPLAPLVQPVRYVPETKRADDLLWELRQEREHLAIVVDEYGGSVGLVTVEDLLEEVIGEIQDERDEDEPGIAAVAPNEWRVPGRAELDELEEDTGIALPEGDYETVAGFLLARLGHIPTVGETLRLRSGLTLRVEEANERAILTVRVRRP